MIIPHGIKLKLGSHKPLEMLASEPRTMLIIPEKSIANVRVEGRYRHYPDGTEDIFGSSLTYGFTLRERDEAKIWLQESGILRPDYTFQDYAFVDALRELIKSASYFKTSRAQLISHSHSTESEVVNNFNLNEEGLMVPDSIDTVTILARLYK
jgi:hypothetical protein